MKHGSVYLGGLSRGDTPPKEIPTVGAGGRPKISEMTKKEMEKGGEVYDQRVPEGTGRGPSGTGRLNDI